MESIIYENRKLRILDQLLLPANTKFIEIQNVEGGWQAIRNMNVRGAPAIAIVGCLSLVVELSDKSLESSEYLVAFITAKLDYLVTARPTAVNMKKSRLELVALVEQLMTDGVEVLEIREKFITHVEKMLEGDRSDNTKVGQFGAEEILKLTKGQKDAGVSILTHCNTGALATAGYGTALGVVRWLHSIDQLSHCYCTETRPYFQGARLTAYELVHEKIPSTLICDSMAGLLMKQGKVDAVVTGADQVTKNGDTANKIGTYSLAVLAKVHEIPFFVAAPSTSINLDAPTGDSILIEERPHDEMTHFGERRIAAHGINCWNPAFDVTPAELITGIITELGVFKPHELPDKF